MAPQVDAESVCVQGDPQIYKVGVPPDAPVLGEKNTALVTIVVFSEFQCPFCARVVATLAQLVDKYPGQLRIAFRHNPLAFHNNAMSAAKAALAAHRQGRFWPMHDVLFENSRSLDEDHLFGFASRLGLDMQQFERDFRAAETEERIRVDMGEAERLGARGVPTFFINGRKFSGAQPLEKFSALIDELLPAARQAGGLGDGLYQRLVACGLTSAPVEKPVARPAQAPEDPNKIYPVQAGDAHWIGTPGAAVEIIGFSDFQCPYCARAAKTLVDVLEAYPGKVRFVFKHLPLGFHKQAKLAAEAAMAAGAQGKFWQMHDVIFANQRALSREELVGYAGQLGLDVYRFQAELDSGAYRAAVERDAAEAAELGIRGTPTFLVNGRKLTGAQPLERFKEAVERALAERR